MGLLSNRIDRNELEAGDHIYSWRSCSLYAHHGIYVEGGRVISFNRAEDMETGTGTFLDGISGISANKQGVCSECSQYKRYRKGVKMSCLDCFLKGGSLYRYEYGVNKRICYAKRGGTCVRVVADPPEETVRRAFFHLEKGFKDYNLFRNNCEDFALYCKTGLEVLQNEDGSSRPGRSAQIAALAAMGAAGLVALIGMGVSAGVYCLARFASDLRRRQDVEKVPVEKLRIGWSDDDDDESEEAAPE